MSLDSQQYANLADHCYGKENRLAALVKTKEPVSIAGIEYWVLEHVDNPRNGYQGTIYQHADSGAIVVAHRGTEPDREVWDDIIKADAGMVATRHNLQAGDAIEMTRRALKHAERIDSRTGNMPEVTVTGHSLGGTLAQITAHHFGLRGETFNAYGAVSLDRRIPEGGNAVINHVAAADVVSAGSPHYGHVRVYATQAHIAALRDSGGYENNRDQVFDLRHPAPVLPRALDFHVMHNFRNVDSDNRPDVSLLRDPQARRLAAEYDPMIDKYRADIGRLRTLTTVNLRGGSGLVRDAIDAVRGDLKPGAPARREAEHRAPPRHPAPSFPHREMQTGSLPDFMVPRTPLITLPDYLQPKQPDPKRPTPGDAGHSERPTSRERTPDQSQASAPVIPDRARDLRDSHHQQTLQAVHAREDNAPPRSIQETPAATTQALPRRQDPLVEQYFAALKAGDEEGARTASMAYATPERWQQTLANAEQRILAKQQQLPGRDNPLFAQAMAHLERLGPQAGGYLDRVQMEGVAGAVAYQARLHHLPAIEYLTPTRDGHSLLAAWGDPSGGLAGNRVVIDKLQTATQPLDQSLQHLMTETQRQQDQALLQAQQRQMETQQQSFSR